ncbi:chondroadherin-like isoform X1 [Pelobates cultripes]|uniref:Chondroadherin-like isoform X1 n=1 Tax=Pelobates cultripes TaxID=61616 RepID=A0AAD1SUW0_PELCU|nr:chondroadherin-like isoform X1 [Pelobates cultripes]
MFTSTMNVCLNSDFYFCRLSTKKRSLLIVLVIVSCVASVVALPITECPDHCTCLPLQQYIQCHNITLTQLPSQFDNNTMELHMQNNNIPVLNNSFVQDMPQIRSLHLSNSNIRIIQSGAFQEINSLEYLYLDSNELSYFEEGSFYNLSNLLYLYLDKNKITYLHPGIFATLKKLNSLSLRYNLLCELSDQSLSGLTQLRRLDLGFNMISNISSNSFSDTKRLRRLNLEWNSITEIPSSVRSLRALQMLRVSGNNISRLSTTSFSRKLKSLTELYLDNTGLKTVTVRSLNRLNRLEFLDLRNNSLQSLSTSQLKTFTKIYLTGNPWKCDCSIIPLHTRLKLVNEQDPEQQATCLNPKELEGKSLITLALSMLTCPAFGETIKTTVPVTLFESRMTEPSISAVAVTTMAFKTSSSKHVSHSTAWSNVEFDLPDPCLSHQISNVLVRALGDETLAVSWSVTGDIEQVDLRYNASEGELSLLIIGDIKQAQLFSLDPGTTYKVCIVPPNNYNLKCVSPKDQQCGLGKTGGVPEQAHQVHSPHHTTTSPLVIVGMSIGVAVLVVVAIVIIYTLRPSTISFQRYYNEDEARERQESDPYKLSTVNENTDEDRQVYVTASSVWEINNEKMDCTLAEPMPSSVPKYGVF